MLKRIVGPRNLPVGAPEAQPVGDVPVLRAAPAAAPAGPNVDPVSTGQPVLAAPPPVPAPPPPPTTAAPAAATPGTVPVPGGVQPVNAGTGGYVPDPKAFGGEGIGAQIDKFGSDAMNAPSRFDAGVVKQGLDTINQDAARQQTERMRGLSELMARRGLVGSSVEADSARNLMGDIESTRQKAATDLALEQARTFAQDRTAAGELGRGAGEFSRELGGDRENANRYGYEAGRTAENTGTANAQWEKQFGLAERGQTADERNNDLMLLLRAYGMLGGGSTATA